MHYVLRYSFGDIAKITAWMSMIEEAIFHRLMARYFDTERAIPNDLAAVAKLVGAKRREEKVALTTVLSDHFVAQSDGWHRADWDAQIAHFRRAPKSKVVATTVECGSSHKPEKLNDINGGRPHNHRTIEPENQRTKEPDTGDDSDAKASPQLLPRATLFQDRLAWLVAATGRTESQCRSLIGRWRKLAGNDQALMDVMDRCQRQRVVDPVSWLSQAFKPPPPEEERTFTSYKNGGWN